ncbi:MAG TPA: hypothetical protein PKU95_00585 [Candidatus Dojkabacteria bacterium]|nr:hypothetical protein [Candidatus Dojkabacteria bacterium]
MAPKADSAPLTTEKQIGVLLKEVCPGCTFTAGMNNALQCQVIKNLRTGLIDPATVLGHPCQQELICIPSGCSARDNGNCHAEQALEVLTDPGVMGGIFTKATAAATLRDVPPNCPQGFNGLV